MFKSAKVLIAVVILFFALAVLGFAYYYLEAKNLAMGKAIVRIGDRVFQVDVAKTAALRTRGLSGREGLGENEGLFFVFDKPGRPRFHTWFMRFPIDVIFLDNKNRVVGLKRNLKPFRMAGAWRGAKTLELPVGIIASTRTQLGDFVAFQTTAAKA